MILLGDNVVVFFIEEAASPYRLHGKWLSEDDQYFTIEGTVGDYIGHELVIPRDGVKFIEVLRGD
jgi:hypothetical protein